MSKKIHPPRKKTTKKHTTAPKNPTQTNSLFFVAEYFVLF
jgi:hypothetical protein